MLGLDLVHSLEADWRPTLDDLARERGWPSSADVAKLGAAVARLSAAYNDPTRAKATLRDGGAARLAFGFVRDVPKGAAVVREPLATGVLRWDCPLRVLDLGAGLGAMSWGLTRALEARGMGPPIDATWVDTDGSALDLAKALVRARASARLREAGVRTIVRSVDDVDDLGAFDLVILGNVLSELAVGTPDDVRAAAHARLLGSLLERNTTEGGFVAVVEPALRDRTRHLHRVRDLLASRGLAPFAPCLHAGPCPALVRPSDWCHEDLPVNLPAWLVPVARAAGLRYEGLTFSYLLVRRAGGNLGGLLGTRPGASRLRVVSDLMKTKGRSDALLCGEFDGPVTAASGADAEGASKAEVAVGGARVMRLDRDANEDNQGWDRMKRGQVLLVEPAPTLGTATGMPRIGALTRVCECGERAEPA